MTIEGLKEKGAIYFEQIGTGIQNPEQYPSQIRRLDCRQACAALTAAWEAAGKENGFCDFYYFRLDQEAKERVRRCLTDRERQALAELELELGREAKSDIIFPLNPPLLQIAARLNAQAVLFSTFYFTGSPEERSTWWGNYNQEYIIFRQRRYGLLTVRK